MSSVAALSSSLEVYVPLAWGGSLFRRPGRNGSSRPSLHLPSFELAATSRSYEPIPFARNSRGTLGLQGRYGMVWQEPLDGLEAIGASATREGKRRFPERAGGPTLRDWWIHAMGAGGVAFGFVMQ